MGFFDSGGSFFVSGGFVNEEKFHAEGMSCFLSDKYGY